jgi:hypothetical protein
MIQETQYLTIKVKLGYGLMIKEKIASNIDDLMLAWRDIVLALGYNTSLIDKYIES